MAFSPLPSSDLNLQMTLLCKIKACHLEQLAFPISPILVTCSVAAVAFVVLDLLTAV